MEEKLRRDIKHLSQSKDPSATTELMEVSTKYDEYMGVLGEVGVEAIKQGEATTPSTFMLECTTILIVYITNTSHAT